MSQVYFDEIPPDARYVSSRVTITETHIVTFAGLTGDFNPLHMDEIAAQESGFGKRIAHGMLGYSLSTGLRSGIDDWAIMAFLQTSRAFSGPILIGDTVHYRATILEKRPSSSKPDRGVVRVGIELVKQDDSIVQHGEDTFLVAREGGE
ncbi:MULTISPECIES: MaoC/PaaZ C-terminal domain-containing protein [Roseovarius]|jgi:3-hydroxybutyryl-CoA dehydratase|uniref:MaoC/PaaZ C-terminal domain-containing protein n=1 Tax=Roseovarius TaxID=74030 RepID=UPI000CDD5000|nr:MULTISPECIES: MaoC/PaaZ C-terminal domain-containing protein [Roseovarius]